MLIWVIYLVLLLILSFFYRYIPWFQFNWLYYIWVASFAGFGQYVVRKRRKARLNQTLQTGTAKITSLEYIAGHPDFKKPETLYLLSGKGCLCIGSPEYRGVIFKEDIVALSVNNIVKKINTGEAGLINSSVVDGLVAAAGEAGSNYPDKYSFSKTVLSIKYKNKLVHVAFKGGTATYNKLALLLRNVLT